MGDIFATEPSDEFLAGDAAPMDMDMSRMGACEDKYDTKKCEKIKKKGQCGTKKAEKYCKKTCDLCKDDCQDTLEKLHCLSKGYSKYLSITVFPHIVSAHLCTVTFGFPNPKRSSFRGNYMRK